MSGYDFIIFISGAAFGSFFCTLAVRYSRGMFRENPMGALVEPSRCISCGHRINPVSLIPVLGYLLLLGKCRHCGARISPLYPATEILCGGLSLAITTRYGMNLYSAHVFLLCCVAVSVSIIDLSLLMIPDSFVIAFLVLSVYPIIQSGSVRDNLLGLALLAGFFLAVLLIFPGSFGGGDLKFASAIGLLFGLELSIVVLETALISGAVTGAAYALISKKGLRTKIPFAPFLAAGIVTAFLWGRDIVLLYYRVLF